MKMSTHEHLMVRDWDSLPFTTWGPCDICGERMLLLWQHPPRFPWNAFEGG